MVRYHIQGRLNSSQQETEDVQDQQRQGAQIYETRTAQDRIKTMLALF